MIWILIGLFALSLGGLAALTWWAWRRVEGAAVSVGLMIGGGARGSGGDGKDAVFSRERGSGAADPWPRMRLGAGDESAPQRSPWAKHP